MTNTERIQANNTELLECIEMAEQLPDAGGATTEKPEQEKTVETTQNGTVEVLPDEGYVLKKVSVVVDVQPILQDKTVTPSYINQFISADAGYDGLGTVKVLGMDEDLIIPSGTLEIVENGKYDVEEYKYVNVNVASSGGGGTEGGNTNTDWFAAFIQNEAVEIYNDKAIGTLAAYAFYERDGVTRIELPNIGYLKERCFYGCTNLETLLLPSLVGYTYQNMAAGCSKLTTVDIHDTSYVSSYTFQNCTSLKKVDLHKVGTIATNAFTGATKFETLIIRTDTVPTLGGTNAFTNTKIQSGGTGYIYVPTALVDSYKAASNWSTYANQIRAIEDYPDICG